MYIMLYTCVRMCYVITWVQVCYVISLHKHVMLHTYVQVQVCYALLNS